VSVPLQLGDGLFFNPALFHAAGQNTSASIERIANLLQISSAFGKPMELVQTIPLIESTWSTLRNEYQKQGLTAAIQTFIATVAEGYPFPLSLDRRPPRPSGMAPESEPEIVTLALKEGWIASDLRCRLEKLRQP
jgi:ectoine hydroxylase-related dioxygenase (phytanoyl-CoA dioxygenase family)